MKTLKELVRLLPPDKISQIELVSSNINRETKLGQLYYGLLNGDFEKEEDAAISIYGPTGKPQAFQKLKQRLRDRLLNTLFFVDVNQPKYSRYDVAATNCYQQYAMVKILLIRSARTSAIWLAETILEYTKKYELHDISFLLSFDLRNHYGATDQDKKRFKQFNNLHKRLREIVNAESEANELVNLVRINSNDLQKISQQNEALEYLLQRINTIEKKFPLVQSHRYLLYLYYAKISLKEVQKDFKGIILDANKVLSLLEKKKLQINPILFTFLRRKRNALFNLGLIDEAIDLGDQVESYSKPKSHNWMNSKYDTTLFLLHKEKYEHALKIKQHSFEGSKENFISELNIEQWRIMEAYLEFLKIIGKLPGEESNFRVNKFLNEVPNFQKEKQGKNVAILLVQLLFMLAKNEYPKYIDRLDALNQYRQRYLKEPNTFRANCIMRMMTKVGKYGFHPRRVELHVKKDFWKLKNQPPEISNSSAEIEIIRYEHMWEMVVELLEENYRKNH